MATKVETGEMELVLGSKQLLSVFFVVVILLGLFFTMGYIVGRNSVPPTAIISDTGVPRSDQKSAFDAASKPVEIDTANELKPVIVPPVSRAESKKPAAIPASEPAKQEPKPEIKFAEKSEPKPKADENAKKEVAAKREEKPAETGRITTGAPRKGHYLQVAAMPEKEAQKLANVLRNKHFSVQLTSSEKGDLYRVLVGPVAEKSDLTKLRESLGDAGLNGKQAFPRKY